MISTIKHWLEKGQPVVLIRVDAIWGSTPRREDARMAVTKSEIIGTIGGGRLEWEAMAQARTMIAEGTAFTQLDMPLGPALGQCCGGRMVLKLQRFDDQLLTELATEEAEREAEKPKVLVCGLGHVGKALVAALAPLPVTLQWWDSRPDLSEKAARFQGDPRDAVENFDAILIVTHIHSTDYEIAEAALVEGGPRYVGMIGSRTKRSRFEKWARARGNVSDFSRLTCPIGKMGVDDKRPEVIAALTAAELITQLQPVEKEAQIPEEASQ